MTPVRWSRLAREDLNNTIDRKVDADFETAQALLEVAAVNVHAWWHKKGHNLTLIHIVCTAFLLDPTELFELGPCIHPP